MPNNKARLLEQPLQPAPFAHDPDPDAAINTLSNGLKDLSSVQRRRRGTPDTLDEILGPAPSDEEDGFVSDDDGAGYIDEVNGFGKRSNGHLDPINDFGNKRRATGRAWQPSLHESFQPGSTPWRGNRRYLCKLYSVCLGFV